MTGPNINRVKLGIAGSSTEYTEHEQQLSLATAATAHPRTKLDFRRCYMVTNAPGFGNTTWQSNSPGGDITPFAVNGYGLFVSFNVASPPADWINLLPGGSGNTAFRTKLASIIAWCVHVNAVHPLGAAQEHYLAFHHEPERDVGGTVGSLTWHISGDNYRAAQEYIFSIIRGMGLPSNWYFTQVLQYNTLGHPDGTPSNGNSDTLYPNRVGTDARRWYSPACDVTGFDGPYNQRGSVNGFSNGFCDPAEPPLGQGQALYLDTTTRWYNPGTRAKPDASWDKIHHWSDFAVSMGGPAQFVIGEASSYVLDPAAAYPPSAYATWSYASTPIGSSTSRATAERADWWSAGAEYWANDGRCLLVCIYDRDSFARGRISGGILPAEPVALRAWSSLADGSFSTTPPPPPPSDFIPGVVPPMTRVKAVG